MVVASHLKSFQAVELAVRTGSLKKAAELLSITPAAVGQRIKTLEDYLGVDLLVRGRSGVGLTPELAGAIGHLHAAFRDLDAAANLLDLAEATPGRFQGRLSQHPVLHQRRGRRADAPWSGRLRDQLLCAP